MGWEIQKRISKNICKLNSSPGSSKRLQCCLIIRIKIHTKLIVKLLIHNHTFVWNTVSVFPSNKYISCKGYDATNHPEWLRAWLTVSILEISWLLSLFRTSVVTSLLGLQLGCFNEPVFNPCSILVSWQTLARLGKGGWGCKWAPCLKERWCQPAWTSGSLWIWKAPIGYILSKMVSFHNWSTSICWPHFFALKTINKG